MWQRPGATGAHEERTSLPLLSAEPIMREMVISCTPRLRNLTLTKRSNEALA